MHALQERALPELASLLDELAPAQAQAPRQASPLLTPDVFLAVSDKLSANERALLMRPLCKEAPGLLADAKVVKLSQAVPEYAFAQKWGQPGSCKHLPQWQKKELMRLTAESGVVANMRLLTPSKSPGKSGAAGCQLPDGILQVAAGAGQLQMCEYLCREGAPLDSRAASAAARKGHTNLVLWCLRKGCTPCPSLLAAAAKGGHAQLLFGLLAKGVPWNPEAAGAAAEAGHERIMRRLLQLSAEDPKQRPTDAECLLFGVASGLDCSTLKVRLVMYRERSWEVACRKLLRATVTCASRLTLRPRTGALPLLRARHS
jgi:hypothetical protein